MKKEVKIGLLGMSVAIMISSSLTSIYWLHNNHDKIGETGFYAALFGASTIVLLSMIVPAICLLYQRNEYLKELRDLSPTISTLPANFLNVFHTRMNVDVIHSRLVSRSTDVPKTLNRKPVIATISEDTVSDVLREFELGLEQDSESRLNVRL